MSDFYSYRTDKWKDRGRWLCQTCNGRKFKTLAGVNRHLMKEHRGDGFGVYRTALELRIPATGDRHG